MHLDWCRSGKAQFQMSEASISLRPINDLLRERFYVPSYQRGFRWTEQQVTDLLDDIWEFQSHCEKKDQFYCLQPIVVKRRASGEWELVDGQQRLTTILLILACRPELVTALGKPTFALRFETRPKSGEFLKAIDLKQQDANIDYFHICRVFASILKWFSGRDGSHYLQLLQCLTNDEESGKNVKVIWYELPETEDPVDAFTRLNVGKIPLTNAELIRALFLRSRNFDGDSKDVHQLKIAQEWDAIEKALQSDEMWYFVTTGATSPASRIAFLFDLIAKEHSTPAIADDFATFHFYNERLNLPEITAEREWLKVKQVFMSLEEWFTDRTLFHLVGYLVHTNYRLPELRKAANGVSKSTFRLKLRNTIFQRLFGEDPPVSGSINDYQAVVRKFVDNLDYDGDGIDIRSLLLLFNIVTIIQNPKSYLRFPFHHFKKASWDIEHVRSVNSDKPDLPTRCQEWLREFATYLSDIGESKELCNRARELLDAHPFDMAAFDALYNKVLETFQESTSTEADNGVGNLVLLDSGTNRSYKNAVFPVKRTKIIGLDRAGTFVPLCTKNVFLKCYSKEIGKMMFWGTADRDAYRDAIIETLAAFFAKD
jgi:hypothetical protein